MNNGRPPGRAEDGYDASHRITDELREVYGKLADAFAQEIPSDVRLAAVERAVERRAATRTPHPPSWWAGARSRVRGRVAAIWCACSIRLVPTVNRVGGDRQATDEFTRQ